MSATNIFARAAENGRQFLVYSMTIKAREDLAMVLPLPVKAGTDEKGVQFIDLSEYPEFFADLRKGFPPPPIPLDTPTRGGQMQSEKPKLEVVQVGSFEASFVPTVKDFSRLDERFRLPPGTWKKLPDYKDYGFAVFKLKPGAAKIHPMAFSFPRREPKSLFFPTVHIHDGEVHPKAGFDHTLYCQPTPTEPLSLLDWSESSSHAFSFMNVKKAKGLIDADQHCYKLEMQGQLPNHDTRVNVSV